MNSTKKIPHRLYLTEDQMPKQWFNLRSAMPAQPDPLIHPATLQPLGVEDLAPIFCEELARQEGILLDPVYTGKAWTKFLMLVKEGYFDGQEHIAFVHTGGAAALFAMDLG